MHSLHRTTTVLRHSNGAILNRGMQSVNLLVYRLRLERIIVVEKTAVEYTEHFDSLESDGNAATKYIVKFNNRVNCDWLRRILDDGLELAQQDVKVDLQTAHNTQSTPCNQVKLPCRYAVGSRPNGQCNGNVAVLD